MSNVNSSFWELSKEAKILLPIMIALGGGLIMMLGEQGLRDEVEANTIINKVQEEQVLTIKNGIKEIKGSLLLQGEMIHDIHTALIPPTVPR